MVRKKFLFLSASISLLAITSAVSYYVPFHKKMQRKYYTHELVASNYVNKIMQKQLEIKSKLLNKYLSYLGSLKNSYIVTSSDADNVYVKVSIPFASSQKYNSIVPLRLLHGNHHHIVYIDDVDGKVINLNSNNNQNFFTIKIPVFNDELEWQYASYLNQYINDDNKVLDLYKFGKLLEGDSSLSKLLGSEQLMNNEKFKIKSKFIYEILQLDKSITFKNNNYFSSLQNFNNYLNDNGFLKVLENINQISIGENSLITTQYLASLIKHKTDIFKKTYYGSKNSNDDWQNTYYEKGIPLGRAATDFAYDFIDEALKVSGSFFKNDVKIDVEIYKWWLRNKPFIMKNELGIDPELLANAGKTFNDQIKFWSAVKNSVSNINYSLAATKDALPSWDESREITIAFYGGYKIINGEKKKVYVDSIPTLINMLMLGNDNVLPPLPSKKVRNSSYPYLDVPKDSRNFTIYQNKQYQNSLAFNNNLNTEYQNAMLFKWEEIINPQAENYVYDSQNLIFKNSQDYDEFKKGW